MVCSRSVKVDSEGRWGPVIKVIISSKRHLIVVVCLLNVDRGDRIVVAIVLVSFILDRVDRGCLVASWVAVWHFFFDHLGK